MDLGTSHISIAVLAGGLSERMGSDKALLRLLPGDRTLMENVIERVRTMTDDLFIVASGRPEYSVFGVPVIDDLHPGVGPLGGIATSLDHCVHDRCLVLSCDHPFLNRSLLEYMSSFTGDWDALLPTMPGESRQGNMMIFQTLHAIYRKSCLAATTSALERGERKTISFLASVSVELIAPEFVSSMDIDFRSFFSVNTPEAREQARIWRTEEIETRRDLVD